MCSFELIPTVTSKNDGRSKNADARRFRISFDLPTGPGGTGFKPGGKAVCEGGKAYVDSGVRGLR